MAFKFKPIGEGKGDMASQLKEVILGGDFMKFLREDSTRNFNLSFLESVEILEAERLSETSARAVFRFLSTREYINPTRSMHGGAQASFYDICTTWTIMLIGKPGFWQSGGMTRSLHTTYMRPAMEGMMLRMECEVMHAGRRLALIRAVMKRDEDGAVISSCEHNKYNIDADAAKI